MLAKRRIGESNGYQMRFPAPSSPPLASSLRRLPTEAAQFGPVSERGSPPRQTQAPQGPQPHF